MLGSAQAGNFRHCTQAETVLIGEQRNAASTFEVRPAIPTLSFLGGTSSRSLGLHRHSIHKLSSQTSIAEGLQLNSLPIRPRACSSLKRLKVFAAWPQVCPGWGLVPSSAVHDKQIKKADTQVHTNTKNKQPEPEPSSSDLKLCECGNHQLTDLTVHGGIIISVFVYMYL